jgi:hypothetical protein
MGESGAATPDLGRRYRHSPFTSMLISYTIASMSEAFPEHIIHMYEDRLKHMYAMAQNQDAVAESLPPFIEALHKLVGVASYFADTQIAEQGRSLEISLKAPLQDLTELPQRLTHFQNLLTQSPYFRASS